jgi:hypothetical protein
MHCTNIEGTKGEPKENEICPALSNGTPTPSLDDNGTYSTLFQR